MHKFISAFVTLSMILSGFSGITVLAEEKAVLIYQDNFDDNIFDWPIGWTKTGGEEAWLEKDEKNGGKMLYLEDNSLFDAVHARAPKFDVKPGQVYTAMADMRCTDTNLMLYIRFWNGGEIVYSTYTAAYEDSNWQNIILYGTAPENALQGEVLFATNTTDLGGGYADNFKVYEGIQSKKEPIQLDPPVQAEAVNAQIVTPEEGHLKYTPYNEEGDVVTDFSYAGFYQGKYELPNSENLPVAATLEPSADPDADDTERIQKVIDDTYANSTNGDYFKVIKLKAGKYNINGDGLNLKSGIVLSGEGQSPDGTILYGTTTLSGKAVININGNNPIAKTQPAYITDAYVEAGSRDFTVDSTRIGDYQVGDLIQVNHPSSQAWCEQMDMADESLGYGGGGQWKEGSHSDMVQEKTITAIEGNKITVDIPFNVPMETTYAKPYIVKINDSGRIIHAGVENLRVDSYYNGSPVDENHAYYGVKILNAKNCYVRDSSFKHLLYSAVHCVNGASQITVKNCSFLDPVSEIKGDRRYSFYAGWKAQQILFAGCYSYDGRHDYATSFASNGIVFTDNVSDQSNEVSETHGTWVTGSLYDNLLHIGNKTNGFIGFANRGIFGIGYTQGWSGAGIMAWNCLSPAIIGGKPPMTYQNFIIGQWGYYDDEYAVSKTLSHANRMKSYWQVGSGAPAPAELGEVKAGTSFVGDCYKDSEYAPVEPRSLYKAQLAERVTGDFRNTRPNAPALTVPRSEDHYETGTVQIEGLYQKGAESVTVYVDNKPYFASLNQETNMFSLELSLPDGTHKIYATQTINGMEGTKCADRFIVINQSKGNADYLQSLYVYDLLHPTINDSVISFDVYQAQQTNETSDVIKVKINGNELETDVAPIEANGRILVPARAIFEALDAEVNYDAATSTATTVKEGRSIQITENETTAYIDGKAVELDAPAVIVEGRFLVPVRFIAESFGAEVSWLDARKTVIVEGGTVVYKPAHGIPNELGVFRAIESGNDGAGNTIENLFDGLSNTRWAVSADNPDGAYGIFDFGYIRKFKDIYIQFSSGNERVYTFDIFVSDDGENYTKISEKAQSSGKTTEMEIFPINASGRYVKIEGHGNSVNSWNNYCEMAFTEQVD